MMPARRRRDALSGNRPPPRQAESALPASGNTRNPRSDLTSPSAAQPTTIPTAVATHRDSPGPSICSLMWIRRRRRTRRTAGPADDSPPWPEGLRQQALAQLRQQLVHPLDLLWPALGHILAAAAAAAKFRQRFFHQRS